MTELTGHASIRLNVGAALTVIEPVDQAIDDARKRVMAWMRDSRTEHDPEPDSDLAIQYTALGTLASMFPSVEPEVTIQGPREIWASAAPHMNDVKEFAYGQDKFVMALKAFSEASAAEAEAKRLLISVAEDAKGEDLYCACFSAKADDLGQWRGYGDDGRGCCVAYGLDDLREAHSWLSGWVIYEPAAQDAVAERLAGEFIAMLSRHLSPNGEALPEEARRSLARLVPSTFVFFKHRAFREEREFRLVYAPLVGTKNLPVHFQERRGRIVPYVRLPFEDGAPLRQIWIGPRNDADRTRAVLEHLKRERGLHQVEVVESGIPYLP